MVEVGRTGAFSVNCVGVERLPFPLSFSVGAADGVWRVTAAAAQAGELADLLQGAANGSVAVVALETFSYLDENGHPLRPSLIAVDLGVPCAVRPLGAWASGTHGLGEEILVLDRGQLPRLLDGTWSPYELTLIDLPTGATPEDVDALALVLGTTGFDEPVLERLGDSSRLWFAGHDDCYLALETRDPALPAAVLARLLTLLAGSALAARTDGSPVCVPEPGPAVAERLVATAPHWIGSPDTVTEDLVSIGLTALPSPWRLDDPMPPRADLHAVLDVRNGTWRIATPE
ncbi:hypothetical protein [Streptomyces sp. NPDC089919]|uniref:hypothetical protein n=1 Tax=Streptomyces sp. NPDC089919 TaxID=3155188 RepID=UPI00344684B7